MYKLSFVRLAMVVALLSLVACVTETNSDSRATGDMRPQSTDLSVQDREIDWDRAGQDAKQGDNQIQKQSIEGGYAVPLLLPPTTLRVSKPNRLIAFAAPKIITDAKGYSAVIATSRFDMLIDASNQMFRTNDAATATYPQDFDGRYQAIFNGAQMTIGRYGALYAIQFLCTNSNDSSCINEQAALEVVQALQVQLP